MLHKTQTKQEYQAPQTAQMAVRVEKGFALSGAEPTEDNSNLENFGDSGNNYGNELF